MQPNISHPASALSLHLGQCEIGGKIAGMEEDLGGSAPITTMVAAGRISSGGAVPAPQADTPRIATCPPGRLAPQADVVEMSCIQILEKNPPGLPGCAYEGYRDTACVLVGFNLLGDKLHQIAKR